MNRWQDQPALAATVSALQSHGSDSAASGYSHIKYGKPYLLLPRPMDCLNTPFSHPCA
jgi:hypothetical protein